MRCEEIVRSYINTLKGEFECISIEGWLKVITPYLYPNNDNIEIFIKEISHNLIRVSDLGETIRYLHSHAFDIYSTPKRKFLFESLASRSNLNIRNGEIYKDIELKQIGEAIFDVIMASKAIGDLIFSSRAYEPALFVEEVASFLKERRVRFEPKVSVQGATGKKYKVDFKIFNHRISYLQTLSPVSKAGIKRKVDATFRMWYDFDGQFQKASLLNDIDFVWPESDIILLQRVSRVIPWSKKEKILELTK